MLRYPLHHPYRQPHRQRCTGARCCYGDYVAIDPARNYTVAVTTYYKGGGFYDILKPCRVLKEGTDLTRDIITDYMEHTLHGDLGTAYEKPQGRITIAKD